MDIPSKISSWVYTGTSEKSNVVVMGSNYVYVFSRVRYAGGRSTIITDIAFCDLVKNVDRSSNRTEIGYQIELEKKIQIIYNTREREISRVSKGNQSLEKIKMGMSITGNKTAIIYETAAKIYGTKDGSGWSSIVKAALAGTPKTSSIFYAYETLRDNAFATKDLGDSGQLQWKIYPNTVEGQRAQKEFKGNCVRGVSFEFKGRAIRDVGEYALCKIKVNEKLYGSNIKLFLKVGY